MEIQEHDRQWPIGHLSELAGMTVRKVRYYSDRGLLTESRAESGHRRYHAEDLARLQLIGSLRALDVDLDTVRIVLDGASDLQQILRAHTATLELRLRALRRQLAVSRAASEGPTERTLSRLHSLSRIETAERDQLLNQFWDDVLRADLRGGEVEPLRQLGVPELPPEPTAQQLDAWLELADLAADREFRERTRVNAEWFGQHFRPDLNMAEWQQQMRRTLALATQIRDACVPPDSADAWPAVAAYCAAYAHAFDRPNNSTFRRWLSHDVADHTDPRAARWWHLVSQVVATTERPAQPLPAAVEWLQEALKEAVSHEGNTPDMEGAATLAYPRAPA